MAKALRRLAIFGQAPTFVGVSKSAKATAPKVDDLPFEEALTRLEAAVEAMENDDLPLASEAGGGRVEDPATGAKQRG
jgi:hypothetical protein